MRQKTCKSCKQKFTPIKPLQVACSIQCAINHANKLKHSREKKEHRAAKEKLKTRQDWMKEAQAAFNKWVRLRDHEKPCISCGRFHNGQWHAGHYLSTGAHPELRFDPLNNNKQCQPCNTHLSGNLIEYRKGLIDRIGQNKVDWLEGPHEPKKYTIEDLREIKAHYTKLARELGKKISNNS